MDEIIVPPSYQAIHKYSSYHRDKLLKCSKVGCFHCITIFKPQDIKEWTDGGQTAICPYCNIDSVLPNKIDEELINRRILSMMEYFYFKSK